MLFIFDMGGVVTSTFGPQNKMYDYLGLSPEKFYTICGRNGAEEKGLHYQLSTGKITVAEFWRQFNERVANQKLDVPVVTHDLFRLFFHPRLNEETVQIIKALHKNHRVVCGTNTIESHWENHMERGDYSYFDQTYASNKIGEEKPDPEFFKLIMTAEGYSPDQTFFTDDKEENILAARRLGINAVRFITAQKVAELWKPWC